MILTIIFNLFATELTFNYRDMRYKFTCNEKELIFTGISGTSKIALNTCNKQVILSFCQEIDFNTNQLKMLSVNQNLLEYFISIKTDDNTYFEKASTNLGKTFLSIPRFIEQLILYNELYCKIQ